MDLGNSKELNEILAGGKAGKVLTGGFIGAETIGGATSKKLSEGRML